MQIQPQCKHDCVCRLKERVWSRVFNFISMQLLIFVVTLPASTSLTVDNTGCKISSYRYQRSMQQYQHDQKYHLFQLNKNHPTTLSMTKIVSKIKSTTRSSVLYSSNNDNESNTKKSSGLGSEVRTKLLSESIAPWRSLRLFLYVSFASGAAIGGFITLAGTVALLSGAKEGNLNTELLNLGIDFGAVAIFVLLFRWDVNKQNELNSLVEERVASKKESKLKIGQIKERENDLKNLKVSIQTGVQGQTQEATLRELIIGARQNIIIVAGSKKVCRDALIGANLLKMDFAMSNILVIPYDIDAASIRTTGLQQSKPVGFATPSDDVSSTTAGILQMYETQPYVARPVIDLDDTSWNEYVKAEIQDAIEQNGDKVKDDGIAIVVAAVDSGKVIRRGVGKVPWRLMVEELEQVTKSST